MNDYSDPKYKDLYKEILIDQQWTWGKFSPIPYPLLSRIQHHEQQRKEQIAESSSRIVRPN